MPKKRYNNRHRKPPCGIFFKQTGKFSNRMTIPSTTHLTLRIKRDQSSKDETPLNLSGRRL